MRLSMHTRHRDVHVNLSENTPKSRPYLSAGYLRSVVRDGVAGYGISAAHSSLGAGTFFSQMCVKLTRLRILLFSNMVPY